MDRAGRHTGLYRELFDENIGGGGFLISEEFTLRRRFTALKPVGEWKFSDAKANVNFL